MHEPQRIYAQYCANASDMVLPALELHTEDHHEHRTMTTLSSLKPKKEKLMTTETHVAPIEIHDLTKNFGAVRPWTALT